MSDWHDRLGFATFRGVPFYVDTGDRSGGRRVASHAFPFSEAAPYAEDLGKLGRGFMCEGYVLGADYETARNALLTALETPGPGELVHPFYGTRTVTLGGEFHVRESRFEGGVAQFSIPFVETSAAPAQPVIVAQPAAVVLAAVTGAKAASLAEFVASYVSLPALRASAAAVLDTVHGAIGEVLDAQTLATQEAAAMRDGLIDLADNAAALLSAPNDLFDAYVAIFEDLSAGLVAAVSGIPAFRALAALYVLPLEAAPDGVTPRRVIETANFTALQVLFQRITLLQVSTAILAHTFDSYDAAVTGRSEIADLLDAHTEATSDDAFPALDALRTALIDAVPGAESDLPRLQHYTAPATLPSLVLAHRLYGHLDLEADLIARNGVRHPGFVPGGLELEILTDG